MQKYIATIALVLGVALINAPAHSQTGSNTESWSLNTVDLAFTYVPERAKASNIDCGCFWFQGGSGEIALESGKGLGVVANLTGQHASGVPGGGNIGKISYLFGPRYALTLPLGASKRQSQLFTDALFGVAHGFDGTFPNSTATTKSANSYALQLGGGWDIALARGFSIRAVQIDYFRSALPDAGSQTQNDLRLAFGISYRVRRQ